MNYQSGKVKTFIIIFMMIGFWFWFFNKAPLASFQNSLMRMYEDVTQYINQLNVEDRVSDALEKGDIEDAELEQANDCNGKLPTHAKLYALSDAFDSLKQKSRLIVKNEHIYPVWLTLFDVDSFDPMSSFYIKPNQHAEFKLPIGEYEIEIQSGSSWCNFSEGFKTPAFLEPDDVIGIKPDQVKHITIAAFGSAPADMMYISGNAGSLSKNIQGRGKLILQKIIGGNYATTGTVNQKPAFFMADTGASMTSVPYDFAVHAGIKGCVKQHFITANGRIEACVGVADELTIGQFVLKDVKISYSKAIPQGTFLLGMNVLSKFKLLQQDDSMVLSRK